jgi:hypothetical protein
MQGEGSGRELGDELNQIRHSTSVRLLQSLARLEQEHHCRMRTGYMIENGHRASGDQVAV